MSPIYAALVLPTVTSYPSLKCLQWSDDGQVCFLTKSTVVILTPDHGINFDTSSVVKSTTNKEDPAHGWFKTMIQHDQVVPIKWPDYSQTWSTVSLGSIDPSLTSVTISPSGLSSNGSCIFVTLSSNMDVNLWTAGKNYLKGEWLKIFEITPFLLNILAPEDPEKFTAEAILQAQIVSIEWTPQVPFGIEPTPWIDGSLLVLGSRAGYLTFLRYRNGDAPEYVASLSVSEKWITHIEFCRWDVVSPGTYEGLVAYGTAGGCVGLVKITQTMHAAQGGFFFTPTSEISVRLEHQDTLIYGADTLAGTTSLRWIYVPGRNPILLTSAPGLIKLWSAPAAEETAYWSGHRALRIQTQKISIDASAFHPVSGVSYLRQQDKLVVTLFDGSFHVINRVSTAPAWCSRAVSDVINSETLSGVSRTTFAKAEKRVVDRGDMARITGLQSYDDASCFVWVYESARPSDFSYKHDAKQSSTLVVAQMWDTDEEEILLENLATLLANLRASSRIAPLHMLRPFLVHLQNPALLKRLHSDFLELLRPTVHSDHSTKIIPSVWEGELDDEIRRKFRIGLATDLFGWDELLSLRLRLSLADFAWKFASTDAHQAECGVVAQTLLTAISHRILRTVIRYLLSVVGCLTPNEIPFVSRMIVQSLLPGCPADLTAEGTRLSGAIQHLVVVGAGASGSPAPALPASENVLSKLNEACPACGVEVPLHDITTAVCAGGHTWARCSVTTFILSTPWVRTCVGCSRKAFLPPSAKRGLPDIARGWVVEELLEAVDRCLFCNNGFVSIL